MSEKQNAEPNDEGWVTVTKRFVFFSFHFIGVSRYKHISFIFSGRNPGFARKHSVKTNIMKTIQRKKRKKTLLNFYTFQIKESKMNRKYFVQLNPLSFNIRVILFIFSCRPCKTQGKIRGG